MCQEVLGPWFAERGFSVVDALASPTLVVWRTRKFFMEFNFWPQDAPDFPVMVGLGLIRDLPPSLLVIPRKPMRHGLGLWELVTDEKDRAVLAESFQDEAGLRRLLGRIRDRALSYAEPLLGDVKAMNQAIRNRTKVS
ncbi:MAG: hypothetical protein M3O87_01960 [Candidatus Dormibacteraeota bacterium]|nr:hypothetical protein [Candidatus Dormibacteraeota bacterium]